MGARSHSMAMANLGIGQGDGLSGPSFCDLKTASSFLQGLCQNFVIEVSTESSILFSL